MAETSAGQAKLDKMIASGMGKQQALKILIDAQKRENASGSSSSSGVVPRDTSRDIGSLNPINQPGVIQVNPGFGPQPFNGLPRIIIDAVPATPISSGGGGTATSAAAAPVEQPKIKAATPDLLQTGTQDVLPDALMEKLILEDIGSQELLLVTRHDLINGQNVIYQPIVNLPDISIRYNSKNIINVPQSSEEVFQQFSIKLDAHIPGEADLNGQNIVYMSNSGDIIVNCLDPDENYLIEVEILSAGGIFNDTIY